MCDYKRPNFNVFKLLWNKTTKSIKKGESFNGKRKRAISRGNTY